MLKLRIGFVLLLLTVGVFASGPITSSKSNRNQIPIAAQESVIPSADSPTLTWISRTQNESFPLNNGSIAAGDHVVLNATFPEELNVTLCEMRVWSGFTYKTTRPLVFSADPVSAFVDIINHTEFDWVIVTGIERGQQVNITCNFTNDDSDFMAWDGTQDQSTYTYANNIVDMSSGAQPENDVFIWESENDTLVIGCLDYSGEGGNWTLNLQVGVYASVSSNGSTVSMDTYYMSSTNHSCNVNVTGYSESNTTYSITREDVKICNFFAPEVTILVVETLEIDERTFNVSWFSTDRNADDMNIYSVWLSNNDGASFMPLVRNFTNNWFLWNSSGWLEDNYMFRVRAYSVDLAVPEMSNLEDPPTGYWPGDYADGFSISFSSTGPLSSRADVLVNHPSNIIYELDTIGNRLSWIFYFSGAGYNPYGVSYEIFFNSRLLTTGHLWFSYGSRIVTVNVDGHEEGIYNYTIYYENTGDSGGYIRDVVFVIVNPPFFNVTFTTDATSNSFISQLLQTLLVISLPGVALIALTVIVKKGFDRNSVERYTSTNTFHS